jgi:hypothetical protein
VSDVDAVADPPTSAPYRSGGGNAALELTKWTQISPDKALIIYNVIAEQHRGLISGNTAIARLAEFADISDLRQRQIMTLCQSALDRQVLTHYCQGIVSWERGNSRPEHEIAQITRRIGSPGTAHAIVDRARGLIPATMFGMLDRISQAIGYVEEARGESRSIIGTAFLVRRDVVITSAHVAFKPINKKNRVVTEPPVRNITRICFPVTPAGPQEAPLADDPVLISCEAHMIEPDKLDPEANATALGRLDYALLRLKHSIDRVEPLRIDGRSIQSGRLAFLIGFPEKNAAEWDAYPIQSDLSDGGRIIHMINSVPGMSGGCVIDDRGVPIGLHEGAIPQVDSRGEPLPRVNGKEQVENRAVLLTAIYAHIAKQNPNPLAVTAASASSFMFEETLVTRLGRRGAQLLADPDSVSKWEYLVRRVTALLPSGDPWVAHPWFTDSVRKRIQKWFTAVATTAETPSRVAFIKGPRGSGKTFMIDMLKRVAIDTRSDVLRIAWTESDTTLAALARQLAAPLATTGTRTSDGHERYENMPALVDALARYRLPPETTGPRSNRLFVAIDAGDGTGSITEPDAWLELVVALSKEPWARVVLCGLPEELAQRVADDLPLEVESEPFILEHIRGRDITRWLDTVGLVAGATPPSQNPATVFDAANMPHKSREELTTAMAALFAIGWHRGILPTEGQP